MKLVLTRPIAEEIDKVVYGSRVETGVVLFGEKSGDDYRVLAIAGPGPTATHQTYHYSGDNDYASEVYSRLLQDNPNLLHIGELHVHPPGMWQLSAGDLRTVRELLKTYEEFIAGVILRDESGMAFYPVYFSRSNPRGEEMEVEYDGLAFRQEPWHLRGALAKARRYCWARLRRLRPRRHARPRGHR